MLNQDPMVLVSSGAQWFDHPELMSNSSAGSLCCAMVRAFSIEGKNAIQPTSVKVLMAGSECTAENENLENWSTT